MDGHALLRPLEELEARMAATYERLSERFASDEEAAAVFFRLAMEERKHVAMVAHVRRQVRAMTGRMGEVDASLAEVEKAIAALDRLAARPDAELADALAVVLAVERGAAENHYRAALATVVPELGRLLQALCGDDRQHGARLELLARARGIEPAA